MQKYLNARKIFGIKNKMPMGFFSKDALCPVKIFGTYKTGLFFSKDALCTAKIFEYWMQFKISCTVFSDLIILINCSTKWNNFLMVFK